jgi:CHAT domain-containing protein
MAHLKSAYRRTRLGTLNQGETKKSISFAYDNSLHCPECEKTIHKKTWIILDSREEPDAWDRCRKDTIHCYQCPAGHACRIQAPLLLHDSSLNRLLYSPTPIASHDEASVDLRELLAHVLPDLPRRIRNEIEDRLKVVRREVLPLAMANFEPEIIATIEEVYHALSTPFINYVEATQRIELCEYALSHFEEREAPMLWATFIGRLAEYIRHDPIGNREANLEKALQLSERALATFEKHDEPIRLAIARMNLGVLYGERLCGDVAANRRRAVQLLEQSLQIFRPRLFPQYCSVAAFNLGIQFLKDEASSRSEDTERAIAAFEEGATAMTPESNPETWGDLHQNLGIAYYRRIKGDAASNLERSIEAYDQALKVRTIEAAPHDWVLTQMDRGNSFVIRVKGERAENIERAIEIYSKAALVAEQRGYDFDWARLQYDLSYAFQMRVRGTRRANMEESIKAGHRALTVLTREAFPDDWGNVQQNLGNGYRELGRAGQPHYFDRAIEAYSAALSVRSPDKSPVDWLMTVDNLSGTYREQVKGNKVENDERGFVLLEQAAKLDLRHLAPRTYLRFLVNLGTAYRDRKSGDPEENRAKAINAFRTAIDLAKQYQSFEDLRRAVLRLALLEGQAGNWQHAYREISSAIDIVERHYDTAITGTGKEAEAKSNWFLYQMLTDACLHTSRNIEAFLASEAGASRVLRDELAGLPIPWPGGPTQLLEKERRILDRLRRLELKINETDSAEVRAQLIQESDQIQVLLEQTWSELAQYPNAAEYLSLRRSKQLSWDQIQKWLEVQREPMALVEFIVLRERIVAFVVRAGHAEPLVEELPLSPAALQTLIQTYSGGIQDNEQPLSPKTLDAGRQLGAVLLGSLMSHLSGITLVCLIPQGILHYVPLHALDHEGRPLLEIMAVCYAPSAAVVMRSSSPSDEKRDARRIFIAGNPTGDLPFSEIEASMVARPFRAIPLIGRAVTKERVLQGFDEAAAAHLATHAYFDPIDPFASGIVLAAGNVLEAREAMNKVLHLDLLVLSACSTGVQMVHISNSLTGLARGFLYAGVKCLVLSLWPVNDLSTIY